MGYWTIIAPEGFTGWILLTPLDLHGPEIEIGRRLIRSLWGRGYATEAARPVLAYALNTLSRLPNVLRQRPEPEFAGRHARLPACLR